MYRNLISSFIRNLQIFCWVNVAAWELRGIFILCNWGLNYVLDIV